MSQGPGCIRKVFFSGGTGPSTCLRRCLLFLKLKLRMTMPPAGWAIAGALRVIIPSRIAVWGSPSGAGRVTFVPRNPEKLSNVRTHLCYNATIKVCTALGCFLPRLSLNWPNDTVWCGNVPLTLKRQALAVGAPADPFGRQGSP